MPADQLEEGGSPVAMYMGRDHSADGLVNRQSSTVNRIFKRHALRNLNQSQRNEKLTDTSDDLLNSSAPPARNFIEENKVNIQ